MQDKHNLQDAKKHAITPQALGFYPLDFIHHSLPYRESAAHALEKTNGNKSMIFTAGSYRRPDETIVTKLPYGKYARLGLHYLCTEAKRTKSPYIDLSTTLRGFMRDLGLEWDAKEAREALEQMRALLSMQMTLTETTTDKDGKIHLQSYHLTIGDAENFTFLSSGDLEEKNSHLVLTQTFYDRVIVPHVMPLDTDRWKQLVSATKSPLALDIYLWLTFRLYEHSGETRIKWEDLHGQFGSAASLRKFKEQFRKALETLDEQFPDLIACVREVGKGERAGFRGILLKGSPRYLTGKE